MKYISLFAGIGGFDYGLEACNGQQQENSTPGGCGDSINEGGTPQYGKCAFRCVWANEWDKYAASIYRYHFTNPLFEGDIRTVDPLSIPEHDLVAGGFPCQSFSIAGKWGGFEDTRGTLFFEICRIARACRTKYLLLENVKGLLNHDSGNTYQTIIRTLDELGYDCSWQVLNSKNFGVPQNRERVFIIGHLRGLPRPQVFPLTENGCGFNASSTERTQACITNPTVDTRVGASMSRSPYVMNPKLEFLGGIMGDKNKKWLEDGKDNSRNFPQVQRVYSTEGISAQLTSQGGGWGAKTGLYAVPILTPNREKGRQNGRKWKTDGEPMFTLTGMDIHGVIQNQGIRRLTPIECERLQGFPDNWTAKGIDKNGKEILISDSQRYKCCGNAVTTKVITAIGNKLLGEIAKIEGWAKELPFTTPL